MIITFFLQRSKQVAKRKTIIAVVAVLKSTKSFESTYVSYKLAVFLEERICGDAAVNV